jgi:aminopeptidase
LTGSNGHVEALAELVVRFGANVQKDQILAVGSELGKEELTRAIVASAYAAGAKFVDVNYWDPHVKRERIRNADPDTLPFVPSWYGERMLALGEQRCARIGLTGPVAPGLLDDLDPALVGRDQLPMIREAGQVVNDRTTNWCAAPCPTLEWAKLVHPDLGDEAAYAKLWEQMAHVCRLDEDDPVAAWKERMDTLRSASANLTKRGFSALHFSGPGTDLRVGLMASSEWACADFDTIDGIQHMPNIPSEETFTTPDPANVEGHVRSTKPLVIGSTIVRGLEVVFEGGKAVKIEAETGAEILRAMCERDEGGSRLGEVALVDGDGRIGALDTVFYDTLIDENAASHVAFGRAYEFTLTEEADRERANLSDIHIDFMIGGPGVEVDGVTAEGDRVPVLRGGAWQI